VNETKPKYAQMIRQCAVGSSLPTSTRHSHRHGVTANRDCIDTICLSWWWARCARNM